MIKIVILSFQMAGGFGFAPMADGEECRAAAAGLAPAIAWGAECSEIELFAEGAPEAPETAPLPPPRPERPG